MIGWIKKLPEQIRRLAILVIILLACFLGIRVILIPESFGEIGHYRKQALDEIIQHKMKYAWQDVCGDCHDDVIQVKQTGYHKNVNCEVCHGPSAQHAESPDESLPRILRGREQCPLCHEYLAARPTGFPQIVSSTHNPDKPCISCHNPHNPVPPHTPADCSACHAEIARIKAVSPHARVSCRVCHTVQPLHLVHPRESLPTKPTTRDFCGKCHAVEAKSEEGIPRIELATHRARYLCWQCHYPHYPETPR